MRMYQEGCSACGRKCKNGSNFCYQCHDRRPELSCQQCGRWRPGRRGRDHQAGRHGPRSRGGRGAHELIERRTLLSEQSEAEVDRYEKPRICRHRGGGDCARGAVRGSIGLAPFSASLHTGVTPIGPSARGAPLPPRQAARPLGPDNRRHSIGFSCIGGTRPNYASPGSSMGSDSSSSILARIGPHGPVDFALVSAE
jgi:hypothetical protein